MHEILDELNFYTHYHFQDLHWSFKSLFFANLQQCYGP